MVIGEMALVLAFLLACGLLGILVAALGITALDRLERRAKRLDGK